MLKKPAPINPGSYTCFIRRGARIRSKFFLCERANYLWVSVPALCENGRGRRPAVRVRAPLRHPVIMTFNVGDLGGMPESVHMEPFTVTASVFGGNERAPSLFSQQGTCRVLP